MSAASGWCPVCQQGPMVSNARCKLVCPICHYMET